MVLHLNTGCKLFDSMLWMQGRHKSNDAAVDAQERHQPNWLTWSGMLIPCKLDQLFT